MNQTSASERTRQLRLLRGLSSAGEKMGSYKSVYSPGLTLAALPKFFGKLDAGTRRAPTTQYYGQGPIYLNTVAVNPIVPTGGYDLFTFTPTQSGFYRIIVNNFGGGPAGNDMDLAVGYGNTPMDIPALIAYDFNDNYSIPPEQGIKVFSFSGSISDEIQSYFSAGCTYQVVVIGYNGNHGGTYTLSVRDNFMYADVPLVSTFYYDGSWQLYRFVAPTTNLYQFNLDFNSGPNNADLFISQPNTALDVQGCIDYDNEVGPYPESLLAYQNGGGSKAVNAELDSGSTYEVLVYESNTTNVFSKYTLTAGIAPPPGTVVADLSGLVFVPYPPGGDSYFHTFTFGSTNTVTISFINVPTSINQITHLQFQGPDGTIAPGDTFTVANPTLTPSVASQDVGGNVYLYTNGSFPLTASSVITLTTANAITGVTFSMN
jgi:hypothetical protein